MHPHMRKNIELFTIKYTDTSQQAV